jgi:hypothetical protein
MAVDRVSTKKTSFYLRGLVRDLPKALTLQTGGRLTPDLRKLRDIYWAAFAYAFYKKAYLNYKVKSKGGTDEWGVQWEPTKGFKKKGVTAKLLELTKLKKAAKEKLILVKTGRLRESFKPGKLSGASYSKDSEDQIFELKRGTVMLGSKVPYAGVHDPKRPLLGDEGQLVSYAMEEAEKAMIKELKLIVR